MRDIIIGVDPGATGAWSAVYVEPDVNADIHFIKAAAIPYQKPVPRLVGSTETLKYRVKRIDQERLKIQTKAFSPIDSITICVEEPPLWINRRHGADMNGPTRVILNRYLEAALYTFPVLYPNARIYTSTPIMWQGGTIKAYIPKVVYSDRYTAWNIYPTKELDTKQRAFLYCACEFGHDWWTRLIGAKRGKDFTGAISDATCIAIHAADKLNLGIPRVTHQPDVLKELHTRATLPKKPEPAESDYAFGAGQDTMI